MKKGLTFETLIGFDDIQKEFELVFNEHRELIKLIMGDNYGIVSKTDVTEYSPLYPSLNNNVLNVTNGKIVTKNGDVTTVDEFSKEIGNFSEDLAVLFVYETIGSKEKRVTNNGNAESIWYERKNTNDSILIIKASEYESLSNDIKNNSVCICVIKYSETPYIDLTNNEYSFNRPMFSPTDISHRLKKGSGDDSVPHSIGINDLSSSNVSLYNQLLSRGMIVSKDVSIAGVKGKSRKISAVVNEQNEIILELFPNAIGYCSTKEDGAGFNDVCAFLSEGTNKVIIPNNELVGKEIWLDVVSTLCLMPPVYDESIITNELTFHENEDNDIIITEGKQTELVDNTISFSDCGTLPKTYEVVFGSDGKLYKEPDVLGFSLLSSFGTNYTKEYKIPVKIQIQLQNNIIFDEPNCEATFSINDKSTLNIEDIASTNVKIKDAENPILTFTLKNNEEEVVNNGDYSIDLESKTITIKGYSNNENVVVYYSNYIIEIEVDGINDKNESTIEKLLWNTDIVKDTTKEYYKKINKITLIKNSSTNSNCKTTILAIANNALDNRLKVALVEWNRDNSSYGVINGIKDIRPIATTLRDPFDLSLVKETGKAIVNSNFLNYLYNDSTFAEPIIIEDFRQVAYLSSQCVNWKITPYGINYPIINENIFDSRSIANCYRSRRLYEESTIYKYAVVLINGDYETNNSKSVKLGFYDDAEKYYEFAMFPVVNSDNKIIGNGMFILYVKGINIKDIQVIVSGKASGFVLLRLTDIDTNSYYEVNA